MGCALGQGFSDQPRCLQGPTQLSVDDGDYYKVKQAPIQ
jgi:hypothetical protein